MSFNDIKKIESPDWYLDLAFRRSKVRVLEARQERNKDDFQLEQIRYDSIVAQLTNSMTGILKNFPSIDGMEPFYNELVKYTLDYAQLKKSLGAVNWAVKMLNNIHKMYMGKLKRARSIERINNLRPEYYGRISSVIKQIKNELVYLDLARKTMRTYPSIKTSVYTVCLFGFPNVGKSTLLSKITSATPEINSYSFTTKKLNLGYLKENNQKVQIIDTPGTLNRFEKMNNIEKQAYLAVKYACDLIVYVFDPTFYYSLEDQTRLYKRIKKQQKTIVYLSKTDIKEYNAENFPKDIITNINYLKEQILNFEKQSNKHKAVYA